MDIPEPRMVGENDYSNKLEAFYCRAQGSHHQNYDEVRVYPVETGLSPRVVYVSVGKVDDKAEKYWFELTPENAMGFALSIIRAARTVKTVKDV